MSYPNFEIGMKVCKFKNFELWQNFSPFAIAKRSTQQRLTMFRSLVDQIDIDDQNPLCLPKKEWLIPLKSLVNKFHLSVLACLIHQLISDKFVLYLINRINHFIAIFYPSSIPPMTLPVIILKMVLHDSSCPLTDTKNRWLGGGWAV